jgi:hypothetical protein
MTAPRRKIPFWPIALAFAAFGAIEVAFVLLVADDPFTRVLFCSLLGVAQVVGAVVFHRVVNNPPPRRRRQR